MKALVKLSFILFLASSLIGCKRTIDTPSALFNFTFPNYDGYSTYVNGTYRINKALDTSNYVIVYLYVNQPGSYNISTNTSCGISFVGSGTFTTLGINSIYLWGKGTPDSVINSANFNILEVNGNDQNQNTQFSLEIESSQFISYSANDQNGGFDYSDGPNNHYDGWGDWIGDTCFGNYYFDTVVQKNTFNIEGYYSNFGGTISIDSFTLHISNNDGSPIKVGIYNSNGIAGSNGYSISVCEYYYYDVDALDTWDPTYISNSNLPFTITITSIKGTSVKGTFSGTLVNSIDSADKINITNGVISL